MIMNSAVRMLDQAAARFPLCPALEDERETLTYAQYRERARRIGTGLLPETAGRRPVLVYLPKSARALCVFMGILYAGCPYVPVDTHMPAARFQKLLESLRPGAVKGRYGEIYELLINFIASGAGV